MSGLQSMDKQGRLGCFNCEFNYEFSSIHLYREIWEERIKHNTWDEWEYRENSSSQQDRWTLG